MTRVKTGPVTRRRHKKIIKKAKGFRWGRSNLFRLAKNAVAKAGQNAYRDRRLKKRSFRQLWILRINAYLRENDEKYSTFMNKISEKGIILNRKILADLAAQHSTVMDAVLKKVK